MNFMSKSIPARYIFLSVFCILVGACAKISTPSGGKRDKDAPVVLESVPALNTKHFSGKSLKITFNEFVVLDNINEKLLVSPPMKMKPVISIKGKSVVADFEEKLKDSTTYTFYFQDAIRDLNEGNIIPDYQFVFSTGPVIDSLSVTGNVFSAYNLEIPEKTQVLLYKDLDDSAVVKQLPDYMARVNQNGFFRINNVHKGKYRLYALKDADNSKNYNLRDEEFAFMNSAIEVTPEKNFIPVIADTSALKTEQGKATDSTKKTDKTDLSKNTDKSPQAPASEPVVETGDHQLFLFEALKKDHYLTSSGRSLKYQMSYTLSLPPDSLNFEFSIPGTDEKAYFIEKSKEKDTIKIWLTDSTLYSQQQITTIVKYPFTDTTGTIGIKEDTILMRFLAPRAPKGTRVKKPTYNVALNIPGGSMKPGQQITLKSETPFRQPDTTRIRLYELRDSSKIKIPYTFAKDNSDACRYFLNTKLLPKKTYLFIADSASFSSIYNECADSIGIKFSVRDPESYSKLLLNILNYSGSRIIQLLDNKEKLVNETYMKADGKIEFPLLENGMYRVRVIYDLNGDGKWTTGDFVSGRQPEPVSYFPNEIEIKSGWDLDFDWDIGIANFKDHKLKTIKKPK